MRKLNFNKVKDIIDTMSWVDIKNFLLTCSGRCQALEGM